MIPWPQVGHCRMCGASPVDEHPYRHPFVAHTDESASDQVQSMVALISRESAW